MKIVFLRISLVLVAALFISIGIYRGEVAVVLNKAVKLCLECVGIG